MVEYSTVLYSERTVRRHFPVFRCTVLYILGHIHTSRNALHRQIFIAIMSDSDHSANAEGNSAPLTEEEDNRLLGDGSAAVGATSGSTESVDIDLPTATDSIALTMEESSQQQTPVVAVEDIQDYQQDEIIEEASVDTQHQLLVDDGDMTLGVTIGSTVSLDLDLPTATDSIALTMEEEDDNDDDDQEAKTSDQQISFVADDNIQDLQQDEVMQQTSVDIQDQQLGDDAAAMGSTESVDIDVTSATDTVALTMEDDDEDILTSQQIPSLTDNAIQVHNQQQDEVIQQTLTDTQHGQDILATADGIQHLSQQPDDIDLDNLADNNNIPTSDDKIEDLQDEKLQSNITPFQQQDITLDISSQTDHDLQTQLIQPSIDTQPDQEIDLALQSQDFAVTISSQHSNDDTQSSNIVPFDQSANQDNSQDIAINIVSSQQQIQTNVSQSNNQKQHSLLQRQNFPVNTTTKRIETTKTKAKVRPEAQENNTTYFDSVESDPLTEFARAAEHQRY